MIVTVWYRFIAFLKLLFVHDPVSDYMEQLRLTYMNHVEQLETYHKAQLSYSESNNLMLRQMIDEKNADIQKLQDQIIKIYNPTPVQTPEEPELSSTPNFQGSGWEARRVRLEEINSRKRREEIFQKVAERENEVAQILNDPATASAVDSVLVRSVNQSPSQ